MESPIAHFPDEVLALPNGVEKVDAMLEYLQQARVRITPEERQCLAEVVVQLSEQLKNVSGRVRGAIHIANSWSDRANYNRALTFHYQAQELIDKDKDPLLHASVLNDLATVFMRLKRLDEANRHLREAIPSAKLVGNRAMAANLMLNLASIEIVASESQESVLVEDRLRIDKLLDEAIAEFEQLISDNPLDEGSLMRLAGCFRSKGRLAKRAPTEALSHHLKEARLLEQAGLEARLAPTYVNIGETYLHLCNFDLAEQHYRKALHIAEKYNDTNWLPIIYKKVAEFFEERNDAVNALKYQKLLNEVTEKIRLQNSNDQIEQLKARFEAERKAKDAEIYQLRFVELEQEKKKSDDLLLNILPKETADELKETGTSEAKQFDSVTVLFTDFKGFTQMSETLSPQDLVRDLHECFSAFDHICEKHGMEKIKTIGDAYMAAGGLPTVNTTHAVDAITAALEMRDFVAQGKVRKQAAGLPFFEIRIGVHTGPVVAGIVGIKKFQYDIWGDTVNTASRMESSGEVGKVNISESTYHLVKNEFDCEFRGEVEAKGKGKMGMYFVYGQLK
jgi:class 3 adenylate cyclase